MDKASCRVSDDCLPHNRRPSLMGREALAGVFGTMCDGSRVLLSLHKKATTTPTTPPMHRAIREAKGTVGELAVHFGQSRDTIMKWRRRGSTADRSHTPHRLTKRFNDEPAHKPEILKEFVRDHPGPDMPGVSWRRPACQTRGVCMTEISPWRSSGARGLCPVTPGGATRLVQWKECRRLQGCARHTAIAGSCGQWNGHHCLPAEHGPSRAVRQRRTG